MRISDGSSDVCSSDLPAPGPRTRRRNPRKLARSQPLPQYGRTARAEENRNTQSRMTSTMTANLQNLTQTTLVSRGRSDLLIGKRCRCGERKSARQGKSGSVREETGGGGG